MDGQMDFLRPDRHEWVNPGQAETDGNVTHKMDRPTERWTYIDHSVLKIQIVHPQRLWKAVPVSPLQE